MRKKWIGIIFTMLLPFAVSGCGLESPGQYPMETVDEFSAEGTLPAEENNQEEKVDTYRFEDNDTLYAEDDDTSIVTMYLTVSEGNKSENTNHTWQEVNSYSVYYYEEHGIERYAVNGLLQVGDENGPLEGELGYQKYVPNATVTIRGQTSSRSKQKNYKIELKDGMGTWNDQRVINLNKHVGDGSRFINKLCYDLLEELPGTVSLQTQFVHLYVKDETAGGSGEFEDYGLYTQVEQPNKSFLKRHGFDKYGQLYKINFFEFYRYEEVIMLKSDADYNQVAFEKQLEIKGDDDHSKLIAMLEDVNDYSISTEEVLEKWFDADNLASWMAFHILVGNIDTQSRNTLIYSPLNSTKWYFISWDCDNAFEAAQKEIHNENVEFGWEHGISNYWGNVLFRRVLKEEEFREVLDAKIREYCAILTEEKLTEMVQAYAAVVKPYAFGETDKYFEPMTPEQYDLYCEMIPKEVAKNYEKYRNSLQEPMPFFTGIPEICDEGVKFLWDSSYDFQNENIYYTFELADNLEFDNPIVKEEDIFVPGYTYRGSLESGQYFVRVKAKNEAGREQYAFDYYVTTDSQKVYGVSCFYVTQDGRIEVETYEE